MRKFVVGFIVVFITLHFSGFSQAVIHIDSMSYEKAKYLKKDLTSFLLKNTRYPNDRSYEKYPNDRSYENIEGDVIYSFVITKEGKLENLVLESSPDNLLTISSYDAMKKMENRWSPTKLNNVAIDKKYTIIFRYLTYLDHIPVLYKKEITRLINNQAYDKAIRLYDDQIYYNPYDAELYTQRSELKMHSGDKYGEIEDFKMANKLNDEIMSVVNVVVAINNRIPKIDSRSPIE